MRQGETLEEDTINVGSGQMPTPALRTSGLRRASESCLLELEESFIEVLILVPYN